ncbi:hypothetical protein GPECTOR_27g655 [Gonium pectorale]|uniref:Peptidase S8/S53 domain-containing protein n=1 Tax=Gonium pectorale TaxID=33097 RepID=A0A150GFW5_GONPE|nr:hypothetical protein GPECTOR_27g655 [Gonium pectorale]|eukprot:KXZ48485.1 hypothetical protein GPECTOR_27g655 [Gonium pectorale]
MGADEGPTTVTEKRQRQHHRHLPLTTLDHLRRCRIFNLRVLVAMRDPARSVRELLPPQLLDPDRGAVAVAPLEGGSGIEVVVFSDMRLVAAMLRDTSWLQEHQEDLAFIVPDFPVWSRRRPRGNEVASQSERESLWSAAALLEKLKQFISQGAVGRLSRNTAPRSSGRPIADDEEYEDGAGGPKDLDSRLNLRADLLSRDWARQTSVLLDGGGSITAPAIDPSSFVTGAASNATVATAGSNATVATAERAVIPAPGLGGGAVGGDGMPPAAAGGAVFAATDGRSGEGGAPAAPAVGAGGSEATVGMVGTAGISSEAVAAAGQLLPWHLVKIKADRAWQLTRGSRALVVAVLDTGFDVTHPSLRDNLWTNLPELNGKPGVDDDGNGYVDDIYGFDFAGSGPECKGDWRSKSIIKCRPEGDISPEPGDDNGHGTHVAGIVAAAATEDRGVAGVAPNVRLMLLKVSTAAAWLVYGQVLLALPIHAQVFDSEFQAYASAIVAAFGYALRMGASVVVCSFGPNRPVLNPTPEQQAQRRQEQALYRTAVQPLMDADVLVVAAAGNEYLDLDQLRDSGSNYLPCTLAKNNVLCVTGTDPLDRLVEGKDGNARVGVNWGNEMVDIGAPGLDINSTVPGGGYETRDGSSTSAPIVAGVAALMASLLGDEGSSDVPADDPAKYRHAAAIRRVLLGSADNFPDLKVRLGRRVDALRALQEAHAALNNTYLLKPVTGSVTMLAPGLSEEYFAATDTRRQQVQDKGQKVGCGKLAMADRPFDATIRVPSSDLAGSSLTRFTSYLHSAGALDAPRPGAGSGVLVLRLSGFLNASAAGSLKVQLAGETPVEDICFRVGERRVDLTTDATLTLPSPGLYAFELRIINPSKELELRWSLPRPANGGTITGRVGSGFGAPPDGMFVVLSSAPATHPRYSPAVDLHDGPHSFAAAAAAAGWHVQWDYATQRQAAEQLSPGFLAANLSASVPPSAGLNASWGDFLPLRNVALRQQLFPVAGSFVEMARSATPTGPTAIMWAPPPADQGHPGVNRSALRCDVWQLNTTGPEDPAILTAEVPSPRDVAPLASMTLPKCAQQATAANTPCNGIARLTVKDVFPDAVGDGNTLYQVRCWGFWSGPFKNGIMSMMQALRNSSEPLPAATYLGNQLVYKSPPGKELTDGTSRRSLAPLAEAPPGALRLLLAFEYPVVTSNLVLGILDGAERFPSNASIPVLRIDDRMVIPAYL